MKIRGGLMVKLVQLGALDRAWRPRLFYPSKRVRDDVEVNDDELKEVRTALEHIRHDTKFRLEKNQRMYANRIYGARLFEQ